MRTLWPAVRNIKPPHVHLDRRRIIHIFAVIFLISIIWIEFGMAHASSFNHTSATVDSSCNQAYFSPDGNPFTLCPGPYPTGGNCVWWAWEQWHLLGYDLPLNWGNAADWIVDADRSGLPLGTTPRLGSIAVFPRADGVWAFGAEGHVAFVTGVSPDNSTFNVTYQNYGDPTPMHVGTGYDVSVINEPRYQDGEMRFIYFPRLIDPVRFSHLPGVDGNGVSQVPVANSLLSSSNTSGNSQIALGLPPGSLDQEFSADFTGSGFTELLLYNRQQGHLDIVTFSDKLRPQKRITPNFAHYLQQNQPVNSYVIPQRVSLSDATTPANGWGSNLDIHIGDFTGSGRSQILLYDRMSGEIQILGLTPQLKIQEHVILPGWGPGWEIYVGQYDGHRSGVFMYNRSAFSNPTATLPAGPTSSTTSPVGPTPGSTSTPQPSPNPTAKPGPGPSPSPTAKPTPSPTAKPSPSPTPSPRPSPSPSPSPTSSPTPSPSPSPTASPSPTSKPESDGNAEPESESDGNAESEPESDGNAEFESKSGGKADPESDGNAESDPEPKSDSNTEPESDAEHGSKTKCNPESDGNAEPDTKSEPESDSNPESDANTDTEPESDAELKSKADAKTDSDAKSKSGGKAVTEPEPESDSKTEADTESKPKSEPESDGNAESNVNQHVGCEFGYRAYNH